jgi:pimeloyl-ACP methyl ester carboxylesterase
MWRGYRIQYAVQGIGQPMVLIHGFGACIGHWRKNINELASAGYQVWTLDLLGFGQSDMPTLDYTLELWQDLFKDFWDEHIQQPAVWVGNSIGGLLVLMILADYPQMGTSGILLNSAGSLNIRREEAILPLRIVMGPLRMMLRSKLFGPFFFNQVRGKKAIRNSLFQIYGNKEAITDELIDMLHQPSCNSGACHVFMSVLTGPPGPRPSELLPRIQQPLLVLWGEDDPWAALRTAKVYQDLSANPNAQPSVTFEIIPKTGHCPHDERPEIINPMIINWLTSLQPA